MADKLIKVIDKGAAERIHITLGQWKGTARIDIRVYYQNGPGEWLPTKRGVVFDEETFEALQQALKGLRFDGTYAKASSSKAS